MKVAINEKVINLELADTFWKKLKGFMGKTNISSCMRFKTNSIHTFFMKEKIDILMTDKNNTILYIFQNVPKNKVIIKKNVYYTYEFPANFLKKIKLKDKLLLLP